MMSLWRVRALQRVWHQLPRSERWALVRSGIGKQLGHGHYHATGRFLWHRIWPSACRAVCYLMSKKTNGRILLCGALTFLWDKEGVSDEEIEKCLKEYDDRANTNLHASMKPAYFPMPAPSSTEPTQSQNNQSPISYLKEEPRSHVEKHSERHKSRMAIMGLNQPGQVSQLCLKAYLAIQEVKLRVAKRLDEVTSLVATEIHSRWTLGTSKCKVETEVQRNIQIASCEEESHDDVDDTSLSVERVNTICDNTIDVMDEVAATKNSSKVSSKKQLFIKVALSYYKKHLERYKSNLPMFGFKEPRYADISNVVTKWYHKLLTEAPRIENWVSFLSHFENIFFDTPTLTPPQLSMWLDSDLEELTGSPMAQFLFSACRYGQALLATSSQTMLDNFNVFLCHEVDIKPPRQNMERRQEWKEYSSKKPKYHATSTGQLQGKSDGLYGGNSTMCDVVIESDSGTENHTTTGSYLAQLGWEFYVDAPNCTVYRTLQNTSGLYKYKVIGSYSDISVKEFMDVQVKHENRKSWDAYVQQLETIDMDTESGSEIVHWVMKFPFPMSSREYVFVRRVWINENAAVMISRAVDHPVVPTSRQYVRVDSYISELVMHSYATTEEVGFDFELTYFDNPQTTLPSSCVNWVATSAMPDFLSKIHSAALKERNCSPPSSET